MPETPHAPQLHTPAGKAERTAQIQQVAKAAADKGRNAASTEGAIEAAVSLAAERAAARDAGQSKPVAVVEPVAQHGAEPEAPAPETEAEDLAEAKPAKEEKAELAVRLKRKQREAQQRLERERQELTARQAEVKSREETFNQWQERQARLDKLKEESPAQWLKEVGMTPDIHKRYVKELLAEGKPEGIALKAENETQRVARELKELKDSIAQEKATLNNARVEQAFVSMSKSDDYAVINSLYGDEPFNLVQEGLAIQQRFTQANKRSATNEEILFNLEVIEATKIAKVTGDKKLMDAVHKARETFSTRAIREAYKHGKKPEKEPEKPAKKQAPGPSSQSRTSQPSGESPAMTQKERRAKAAQASSEARAKLARGETRYDPSYLAGDK